MTNSAPESRRSYFYPRPPRGGRPAMETFIKRVNTISIHALREEGDRDGGAVWGKLNHFYPRPPRGGRHDG